MDTPQRQSKDFSIVIPVRGNLKGLRLCLGAFQLFTHQPNRIEILLIADRDDPDLDDYFYICEEFKLSIQVHAVERSDNFCRDYYNYGAEHSTGANIMVYNDDCYMQTDGWDDIIRDKVKDKDLYLVDIYDSTHDKGGVSFPRFPMISRKAMEVVGFFFYPQVRMYPADRVIWELYSKAGLVIPCHEVKMQHDHINELEPSKSRLFKIYQEDISNAVFPVQLQQEIDKLRGEKR